MRGKRIVFLLLAGLIVVGLLAAAISRSVSSTATKVTLARAQLEDLAPKIFGIGIVEAQRSYLVGPTQSGRVLRVLVDQGDTVRMGQLLAELDPVDLDERLAGARSAALRAASGVVVAEAQVAEAQSRSTLADHSATRYAELRQKNFVSGEVADAKQHEANAAKSALDAAKATLEAARRDQARVGADLAGTAKQRAQYRLSSPIDALVSSREAEPGSTVVAGQAVLRLIDTKSIWVKARIDQGRTQGLATGQTVAIVLRSRPNEILSGRVARIEVGSDSVTEERLVDIAFDKPPENLSLGELAEVTIALPLQNKVLTVPSSAIHRVQDKTGVWRSSDQRASFQSVRSGAQTLDGRTQILDGLQAGDEVVEFSAAQLHGGDKLQGVASLTK